MHHYIPKEISKKLDQSEQKLQLLQLKHLCGLVTKMINRSNNDESKYLRSNQGVQESATNPVERGIAKIIIGPQANEFNALIDNIIAHINSYREITSPCLGDIYQSSLYIIAQHIDCYLKVSSEYLKLNTKIDTKTADDHPCFSLFGDGNVKNIKDTADPIWNHILKNMMQRDKLRDCLPVSVTLDEKDTPNFIKNLRESFKNLQDKINPQWRVAEQIPDDVTDVTQIIEIISRNDIKTTLRMIDISTLRPEVSESYKRALSFYLLAHTRYLATILQSMKCHETHIRSQIENNKSLLEHLDGRGFSTETETLPLQPSESYGLFKFAGLLNEETQQLLTTQAQDSLASETPTNSADGTTMTRATF